MYFKVFFIFTVMHILSSVKTLYKLLASNAFWWFKATQFYLCHNETCRPFLLTVNVRCLCDNLCYGLCKDSKCNYSVNYSANHSWHSLHNCKVILAFSFSCKLCSENKIAKKKHFSASIVGVFVGAFVIELLGSTRCICISGSLTLFNIWMYLSSISNLVFYSFIHSFINIFNHLLSIQTISHHFLCW